MNLLFASDSVFWASWIHSVGQVPSLRHTNEVVAAYVACGGRIHLYDQLDKLGESALYCDTDSVIFVQTDEPPLIECGDALGDTTSELKGNVYISEFVSWGPKNYAYKLCNSVTGEVKTVCKVPGITLHYKAYQLVNFNTIKGLVLNGRSNITVTVRTDKKTKRKRGDGACVSIVTE